MERFSLAKIFSFASGPMNYIGFVLAVAGFAPLFIEPQFYKMVIFTILPSTGIILGLLVIGIQKLRAELKSHNPYSVPITSDRIQKAFVGIPDLSNAARFLFSASRRHLLAKPFDHYPIFVVGKDADIVEEFCAGNNAQFKAYNSFKAGSSTSVAFLANVAHAFALHWSEEKKLPPSEIMACIDADYLGLRANERWWLQSLQKRNPICIGGGDTNILTSDVFVSFMLRFQCPCPLGFSTYNTSEVLVAATASGSVPFLEGSSAHRAKGMICLMPYRKYRKDGYALLLAGLSRAGSRAASQTILALTHPRMKDSIANRTESPYTFNSNLSLPLMLVDWDATSGNPIPYVVSLGAKDQPVAIQRTIIQDWPELPCNEHSLLIIVGGASKVSGADAPATGPLRVRDSCRVIDFVVAYTLAHPEASIKVVSDTELQGDCTWVNNWPSQIIIGNDYDIPNVRRLVSEGQMCLPSTPLNFDLQQKDSGCINVTDIASSAPAVPLWASGIGNRATSKVVWLQYQSDGKTYPSHSPQAAILGLIKLTKGQPVKDLPAGESIFAPTGRYADAERYYLESVRQML